MKTITIQVANDKDAELLMDLLRITKFESDIEAFEEPDTISPGELQMYNQRTEEYIRNPAKGKDIEEVTKILKDKYAV